MRFPYAQNRTILGPWVYNVHMYDHNVYSVRLPRFELTYIEILALSFFWGKNLNSYIFQKNFQPVFQLVWYLQRHWNWSKRLNKSRDFGIPTYNSTPESRCYGNFDNCQAITNVWNFYWCAISVLTFWRTVVCN